MANVTGLLFDFNGTMLFDSDFHIEAFMRCYERYGLPCITREQMVASMFGLPNSEIFRKHFKSDFTSEELDEFESFKEEQYRQICLQHPERFKLCDGLVELLDYLKQNGIPYCIATGSPYKNVKFYFDHLELGRWFTMDNIVYTTGEFAGKPAPDIYNLAAARLGLSPEECAIFEDGTSGLLAARASGAARVIAVWEEGIPSPITDKARPDCVYHDFNAWREILTSLGLARF